MIYIWYVDALDEVLPWDHANKIYFKYRLGLEECAYDCVFMCQTTF